MHNAKCMNRFVILISLSFCLLLLVSCKDQRDYYYTPTIDVEVNGGTSGEVSAPLNVSGSTYTPYQGSAYWGEEGRAANSHYTPYDSEDRNLNYYRGQQE